MPKKWIKLNDISNGQYSVDKDIRLKASMLRSNLCDYSDAYTVVKTAINFNTLWYDMPQDVVLKNNTPLTNGEEDFDIVIPICNLLEYGYNYSMTSRSLWNHNRDETDLDGYA